MIVVNGYITVLSDGSGFDSEGNPVANPEYQESQIPCNYVRSSYNKNGFYENGRFYNASYIILVEEGDFKPCRIRLHDSDENDLGEYDVRQNGIVRLSTVAAIQITV